jgi:hypothetical protein
MKRLKLRGWPLLPGFLAAASAHCAVAAIPVAGIQAYPPTPFVVNVTKPPYSAKGDGVTDDTEALQRALNENVGRHKALYFPKGTYFVSRTLTWPKKWNGRDNWGKTMLRGEQRDLTAIRLMDGAFTNVAKPEAIMWCGGFGSADWFHNYVENLTFDVGAQNPGAIALQFYSNNSGAVRDCRFFAGEGSGAIGLDLAHRDMNGPLLVRNCEVTGFQTGIATARSVNGQVFEHIMLRGQRSVGFRNEGQTISIRGLTSDNAVPAVSTYGTLCLIEAKLTGRGDAAKAPAIVNFNGARLKLSAPFRHVGQQRAPRYSWRGRTCPAMWPRPKRSSAPASCPGAACPNRDTRCPARGAYLCWHALPPSGSPLHA